jgi:hypothetical protein
VRVNADQLEALFAANAPAPKAPEEDKSKSAVIQVCSFLLVRFCP